MHGVLARIRNTALHRPKLCLLLALVALLSQTFAVTLDWCLHGNGDAHVASAILPCHDAAAAAPGLVPLQGSAVAVHCVDHQEPRAHGQMISTVVDASAASLIVAAFDPAIASIIYLRRDFALFAAAAGLEARSSSLHPARTQRPRISGAIHGASARLLI